MILFEDKDIIVGHKPAGIPVQSARIGQKDLVSILNNYLAKGQETGGRSQKNKGRLEPVRVVHRLDQPVEGVLVFAKSKKAAAELGRQITDGRMKKTYQAVCCMTKEAGSCEWKKGETYALVDYLVKDGRTNTSFVAGQGEKDAKRAELFWEILDFAKQDEKKYVLVRIDLRTGRHHQIRVQMAHAGLPLYGDQKYNSEWEAYQLKRAGLALCAVSLAFFHPVSGKYMTFEVRPEAEIFSVFSGGQEPFSW